MSLAISPRLRGIVHQLRSQKEITRHQRMEIAAELEQIGKLYPALSDRVKAVLRGFRASLVAQPNGNYYVCNFEYFTAAADLLFTLPDDP